MPCRALVFDQAYTQVGGHDPQQEDDSDVQSIENLNSSAKASGRDLAEASQRASCAEPHNLHPRWRFGDAKLAAAKKLLGFLAAQFSARCFRNAPRRNQLDAIRRKAQTLRHLRGHRGGNGRVLPRIAVAHLGHDHELCCSRTFVLDSKCDDATLTKTVGASSQFLYFVGIQISAAFDDDVLNASGDVNLPVCAIGAI